MADPQETKNITLNGKSTITLTLAVVLVSLLVSAVWSASSVSRTVAYNSERIAEIHEAQAAMPIEYVPRSEIVAELKAVATEIRGLRRDVKAAMEE